MTDEEFKRQSELNALKAEIGKLKQLFENANSARKYAEELWFEQHKETEALKGEIFALKHENADLRRRIAEGRLSRKLQAVMAVSE